MCHALARGVDGGGGGGGLSLQRMVVQVALAGDAGDQCGPKYFRFCIVHTRTHTDPTPLTHTHLRHMKVCFSFVSRCVRGTGSQNSIWISGGGAQLGGAGAF